MAAPTLAAIPDVEVLAGAPLHVALDGFDADGDAITYQVSTSNPGLNAEVPVGNDSLKISVTYTDADGQQQSGDMVLELFDDLAPITTAQIKGLAKEGFYDGLKFHRIIQNFMIQGGDPKGDGSGGSDKPDIDDQFHPKALHTSRGILSMAKSFDDTGNSQFFITAGPTRHLDYNHSVFGFLVEGESVRAGVASVPVTGETPDDEVVMTEVTVFPDTENGVLRLSADQVIADPVQVTVTARDSTGATATQSFMVTVAADTANTDPMLGQIDPIQTDIDTPIEFDIPASDIEGDTLFFGGWNLADPNGQPNPDLDIEVNTATGRATVTPKNGTTGVHMVIVGVNDDGAVDESQVKPGGFDPFLGPPNRMSSSWDFQSIPVAVGVPVHGVQLAGDSDTGVAGDGVTSVNVLNAEGKPLQFVVTGVTQDADVSGRIFGQEVAQSEISRTEQADGTFRVIVEIDEPNDLAEGDQEVTVVQSIVGQEPFSSEPIIITIDNSLPVFTSDPDTEAVAERLYDYDVETAEESDGGVTYSLIDDPPENMSIDPSTGKIEWTPTPDQIGTTESVTVEATDSAGNTDEQTFDVNVVEQVNLGDSLTDGDTGVLRGYVYLDSDGDGHMGENVGLPGVTVTLTQADGEFEPRTFVTTSDGSYVFTGLPAGTYTITQTHPDQLLDGAESAGTLDGTAGEDEFTDVVLDDDEIGSNYNFAERGLQPEMITINLFLASTPPFDFRDFNGTESHLEADVNQDGSEVTVIGSDGDDTVELELGSSTHTLTVNGEEQTFDAEKVASFHIDGGRGNDTFRATGTDADDVLREFPRFAILSSGDYTVVVRDMEDVAFDGAGGQDAAVQYDSAGDDLLEASEQSAVLSSGDLRTEAIAFELVQALSDAGGDDKVDRAETIDFLLELEESDWLEL
jgi:cyclophilin family peptidyl-prolyl cis-trans isomerase